MAKSMLFRRSLTGLMALGALLFTATASATWAGGRASPSLAELFVTDATGETGWLYGQEDIASDGATFNQPEPNRDFRNAYAGPESQNIYLRAYVSASTAPDAATNVYFFVSTSATATSAAATTVDAKLTGSPPGTYNVVIGIKGNNTVLGIWTWSGSQWNAGSTTGIVAEVGTDVDPIGINGDTHGYVQARAPIASIAGLTAACSVTFLVRTTHDTSYGDLDVGAAGACDQSDGNANGAPDVLEPPLACTADAECPGDAICLSGQCIFATPCLATTDCRTDEDCVGGKCQPRASGVCSSNADCGDRVCEGGRCSPCTPGGIQCSPGMLCAPTSRCVTDPNSGTGGAGGTTGGTGGTGGTTAGTGGTPGAGGGPATGGAAGTGGGAGTGGQAGSGGTGGFADEDTHDPLEPSGNEDVQGGACACSAPGARTTGTLALLALPLAWALRRSRRRFRSR